MILELGKSYETNDGRKVTMGVLRHDKPGHLTKAAFFVREVGYYDINGTYSAFGKNHPNSIKESPVQEAKKLLEKEGYVVTTPVPPKTTVQIGYTRLVIRANEPVSSDDDGDVDEVAESTIEELTKALVARKEWRDKWLVQ